MVVSERVCAVVVTFNRKALLRTCLLAVQAQLHAGDQILVVDNASSDGTHELLEQEFPYVQRLRLPQNLGGSGGFYEGMRWAYEQGFDWLWLMDDDGRPAPDCLPQLRLQLRPNTVVVPLQQDSGGHRYGVATWRKRSIDVTVEVADGGLPKRGNYLFAFVGPLIARGVVERVGLPNKDFFIWFDDYDYGLRIQQKLPNAVTVVPTAIFYHDLGGQARKVRFLGITSMRSDQPAWKIYYGARNQLYTILRTRRNLQELLLFFLINIRLLLMDIAYGPEQWKRVRMRLLGFRDGVMGRLGKQAYAR